jgi:hypothetical protein
MMLDKKHLRTLISVMLEMADAMLRSLKHEKPVLYSPEAVELLMGTAAVESLLGKYRYQLSGGPARGIFQMEPTTEASIWRDMFPYKPGLAYCCQMLAGVKGPSTSALAENVVYQILMARYRYLWVKGALPKTLDEMGDYWKRGYNTAGGRGTAESFVEHYRKYAA